MQWCRILAVSAFTAHTRAHRCFYHMHWQEDLVLLTRGGGDSHYRVLGGVVCFPAHWSVLEKLGQQLPDVHDPVPRWR